MKQCIVEDTKPDDFDPDPNRFESIPAIVLDRILAFYKTTSFCEFKNHDLQKLKHFDEGFKESMNK